jgi:peroxiredoxin Q/BCP
MAQVKVGDLAPDVTLVTHAGDEVSLAGYRGKQPVVVFFYPKDGTPVCTAEVCGFRDAYEDFVKAGAAVVGVSGDAASRHEAFAAEHRLPFQLVSDADGGLRRAFGVHKSMGIVPGRVTYVIDMEGIVRLAFNSQLAAQRHVDEALAVLHAISDPDARRRTDGG